MESNPTGIPIWDMTYSSEWVSTIFLLFSFSSFSFNFLSFFLSLRSCFLGSSSGIGGPFPFFPFFFLACCCWFCCCFWAELLSSLSLLCRFSKSRSIHCSCCSSSCSCSCCCSSRKGKLVLENTSMFEIRYWMIWWEKHTPSFFRYIV